LTSRKIFKELPMPYRTNWHRLFGLMLADFFTGSPYSVELEKDLSIKKQLLDVVILRKGKGKFVGQLPDGFDNLAKHNLITFKSHHETLEDWALKELTGHYVNYRKQVSPSFENLLPEKEFRLYAVTSRFPHELAGSGNWKCIQDGVFDYQRGSDTIRVIVLRKLPDEEQNAGLHLLSAAPDKLSYGAAHYGRHSPETSTLINRLYNGYQREGMSMPYTMEDFRKDYVKEHLEKLSPEERVEGLLPEQLRKVLPLDQLLKVLSPDERLAGLSPEEIDKLLRRHAAKSAKSKPKKKK